MKKTIFFTAIMVTICIISSLVDARESTGEKIPGAILVQLKSEKNKIAAMTKAHDTKNLELVKKDAIKIKNAMINDFKDHITYCPVYFYMDTNVDKVKAGNLDGVLFTANNTLVPASANGLQDNKYIIVFYGYPITQSHKTKVVPDSVAAQPQTEAPNGKGLIINNPKMEQISYLYKFDYENWTVRSKQNRKYIALSKKFDMEYFPTAAQLDAKLYKNQHKIEIKHIYSITSALFEN